MHGGRDVPWPLPRGEEPGGWHQVEGDLIPCGNGLHVARAEDLVRWVGPELYEVETDAEMLEVDGKVVVRSARLLRRLGGWDERSARTFACECAERALAAMTAEDAATGHDVIKTARRYAAGDADAADMREAARVALAIVVAAGTRAPGPAVWITATAEVRDAASSAAWDATWNALLDGNVGFDSAWETCFGVANAGAWDASGDAAWAVLGTTRAAGWAAARDAARDAARAIAWNALTQARDALRDRMRGQGGDARSITAASWGDARSEIRARAFSAERAWQTEQLFVHAGSTA